MGHRVWGNEAFRKPKGLGRNESALSKEGEIKSNTRWGKEAFASPCERSASKNPTGVEGGANDVLSSARRCQNNLPAKTRRRVRTVHSARRDLRAEGLEGL